MLFFITCAVVSGLRLRGDKLGDAARLGEDATAAEKLEKGLASADARVVKDGKKENDDKAKLAKAVEKEAVAIVKVLHDSTAQLNKCENQWGSLIHKDEVLRVKFHFPSSAAESEATSLLTKLKELSSEMKDKFETAADALKGLHGLTSSLESFKMPQHAKILSSAQLSALMEKKFPGHLIAG